MGTSCSSGKPSLVDVASRPVPNVLVLSLLNKYAVYLDAVLDGPRMRRDCVAALLHLVLCVVVINRKPLSCHAEAAELPVDVVLDKVSD
jgi:hypothetical protein